MEFEDINDNAYHGLPVIVGGRGVRGGTWGRVWGAEQSFETEGVIMNK
jgi:hypothetical protein